MACAQVDLRLQLDRLTRSELEPEAPGEHGDVELHFYESERLADACSRTQSKGKISKTISGKGRRHSETVGIETIRLWPPFRMSMYQIGRDEHVGIGCNRVTSDDVRGDRSPGQQPTGRVEAHGFLDHLTRVGQSRNVLDSRLARVERVELGMEAIFSFGMLRQQIPCPIERASGGLVTSHDQRH